MRVNNKLKSALAAAAALLVLIPATTVGYQHLRDPAAAYPGVPAPDPAIERERGAYLARAGNCMACHTEAGGARYAGGRAIATPFGAVYAPNITPDAATGIGAWSADDFWRALHDGKSRDGSFLYPAFPYPNYTRVTRADSDALYAYLRALPAVRQENRGHALRFPYNQRWLLAFWRAAWFRPGVFEEDPARTPAWNRGAYLVEGLGHCAACHTARNAAGGAAFQDLGGGMMPGQGWYAPSLGAHGDAGLGAWKDGEIAGLLKTGVSARGAVQGPMAEVVAASLQHLDGPDLDAMLTYLRTVPAQASAPAARPAAPEDEAVLQRGGRIYAAYCVECHGESGQGAAPAYPPLAGNTSLSAHTAVNPIRIVLNGGYPPSTGGNPRPYGMPPFGATLSDRDVAAVLSYVRGAWGNRGAMVSDVEVARTRGAPSD